MPISRMMLRKCGSIARGHRNNCAPISLVVAPVATSRAMRGPRNGRLRGPLARLLAGGAQLPVQCAANASTPMPDS